MLTQFLHNILYGEPIKLVDGGTQRRSFTYISDGIDALMAILENRGGAATAGSSTSGTPPTISSIRDLATRMIAAVGTYPGFEEAGRKARIVDVSSGEYYGDGYQDILTRVPSIRARASSSAGSRGSRSRTDPPDARLLPPEPPGRAVTARRVALKVDCDTLEGTREGIPRLLEMFAARGSARRSSSRSAPTARAWRSGASSRARASSGR